MITTNYKVTILLATHNRAHLIGETLDSILAQTYRNWECIIVDDYSKDSTAEVVRDYEKKDSRFSYYLKTNKYKKGLPGTRNYSLDLAKERGAEFVQFFDDDDVAHPKNLEICIEELKASGSDFCHYQKKSFTTSIPEFEKNNIIKGHYNIALEQIEQVVTNKIALASCTVMWKKECFKNIRFDESLLYAEEWECYIRILVNGYSGIGIKSTLYFNRKHPKSNTGEFWSGNQRRRNSKIKAVKLVIDNLVKNQLLSKNLFRHFIQIGIFLKEFSIVKYVLRESRSSIGRKTQYCSLYYFYPIVGRLYRLKKILLKNG